MCRCVMLTFVLDADDSYRRDQVDECLRQHGEPEEDSCAGIPA